MGYKIKSYNQRKKKENFRFEEFAKKNWELQIVQPTKGKTNANINLKQILFPFPLQVALIVKKNWRDI